MMPPVVGSSAPAAWASRVSGLSPIMPISPVWPLSGRDQRCSGAVGGAVARREPGGHAGPVTGAPVLAHLPLALEARDRHPQADDPPQLRAYEGFGRLRDGPGLGAGPLMQVGQPRDHAEEAVRI